MSNLSMESPKDAEEAQDLCARLIGKNVEGIEIDTENELVKMWLSSGFYVEFSGEDLDMYIGSSHLDS